jgi:guanylate kinase
MSISKEAFIAEVEQNKSTYSPNEKVQEQLNRIDLTTISAPSGMGKDTIMRQTELPIIIADTIRSLRINNGAPEEHGKDYYFRGGQLDAVLDDFNQGNYVQIGMGPSKKSFYGTRIEAYPQKGPALMDIMTNQINIMRELPFASVKPTIIVAPSYNVWIKRLEARGSITQEDWQSRRHEAVQSLTDGLEDEEAVFILNDALDLAAKALYNFAVSREYRKDRNEKAKKAALDIIRRLKEE